MLAYTAAGQFHSFAFVPHTARRGSGRRIPRWHPNSSSVRPCAPGSTKTVSGSLVRPHRLHREPPEHGMPRLDSRRGLRVLWQRQRFAGTRNCGGWQVIHGPPARLILKRAASQGIGRVHARIRLCTDGRCELLGLVWGRLRLGASSRTPRENKAHQKEVCFHSKRCLAAWTEHVVTAVISGPRGPYYARQTGTFPSEQERVALARTRRPGRSDHR